MNYLTLSRKVLQTIADFIQCSTILRPVGSLLRHYILNFGIYVIKLHLFFFASSTPIACILPIIIVSFFSSTYILNIFLLQLFFSSSFICTDCCALINVFFISFLNLCWRTCTPLGLRSGKPSFYILPRLLDMFVASSLISVVGHLTSPLLHLKKKVYFRSAYFKTSGVPRATYNHLKAFNSHLLW